MESMHMCCFQHTLLLWVCPFLIQAVSRKSKFLPVNAFWSGGREHLVMCMHDLIEAMVMDLLSSPMF